AGSGSTDLLGTLKDGRTAQVLAQLTAALVAVGYSFIATFVIVKAIDWCWGFSLDPRAESEGLDRSEHGEVGFDLGPALELIREPPVYEPRSAAVPPNGQRRFTVIVEGADPTDVSNTWSDLCQTGPTPPVAEFRSVYPYLTTFQDNRFRFRGGDPEQIRQNL